MISRHHVISACDAKPIQIYFFFVYFVEPQYKVSNKHLSDKLTGSAGELLILEAETDAFCCGRVERIGVNANFERFTVTCDTTSHYGHDNYIIITLTVDRNVGRFSGNGVEVRSAQFIDAGSTIRQQLRCGLLVGGARDLNPVRRAIRINSARSELSCRIHIKLIRCRNSRRLVAQLIADSAESLQFGKYRDLCLGITKKMATGINLNVKHLVHSDADSVVLISEILNRWSLRELIVE